MATIDVTEDTFEQTVTTDGIVIVDTEANQGLSAALQIQSIPTLMIFREGILVYREAGALPAAALEDLIGQVKGLDMEDVKRQVAEQNNNN